MARRHQSPWAVPATPEARAVPRTPMLQPTRAVAAPVFSPGAAQQHALLWSPQAAELHLYATASVILLSPDVSLQPPEDGTVRDATAGNSMYFDSDLPEVL